MHQALPVCLSRIALFRSTGATSFRLLSLLPWTSSSPPTWFEVAKFHHPFGVRQYSQQKPAVRKPFNWGSNKKHRDFQLKAQILESMAADPKIEEQLAPLREAVKEQVGDALWWNPSKKCF